MKAVMMAVLAMGLVVGVSAPAFAGGCPKEISAIDATLEKNSSLSAEQRAEIETLRDKGEVEHKLGKHQESMATLAEAKKKLGM